MRFAVRVVWTTLDTTSETVEVEVDSSSRDVARSVAMAEVRRRLDNPRVFINATHCEPIKDADQ